MIDLTGDIDEIDRLKKDIKVLIDENSFLKVSAANYQKQAMNVLKKFVELESKTKTSNVIETEKLNVDS